MKVGLQSMRLGSTMYFVPFFFVLNPALILRGEPVDIVVVVATAFVGIVLIASAFEGYLVGFGRLGERLGRRAVAGLLMFAGGLSMALPGGGDLGLSHLQLSLAGLGLAGLGLLIAKLGPRAPTQPAA